MPFGQQFGGMPTGRLGGHFAGGFRSGMQAPRLSSCMPSGQRQALSLYSKPWAQQLGGVPTGFDGGHTSFSTAQARPSHFWPAGQAQRPSALTSIPPVQAGANFTSWQSSSDVVPAD